MLIHKKNILCIFISITIIYLFPAYSYANTTDLDIVAESAILLDAKSGQVLYSKNEHKRMYPASITKLLTALIAIENHNPTDIITLSKEAVYSIEPGSSHIGLDVGEQVNLDQGLHALLLASANEVANGIAELCGGTISDFCINMTNRAHELGAVNTNFTNPHGLHDPNHYTTAYDMALIAREVMKQPYFLEIMNDITYQIPPTNKTDEIRYLSQQHRLMNKQRDSRMYRDEVIGGKTGFTTQAGNTLVTIAKDNDMELICVVLKSNSSNLYSDTNKILDFGFDNYKSISLYDSDSILSTIPMYTIKSGQLIHVADCDLTVDDNQDLIVPSDLRERNISTDLVVPDKLTLNSKAQDVVGSVVYNYMGSSIGENNLIIKDINYIASSKPAIYPQKPEYLAPAFNAFNNIPIFIFSGIVLVILTIFLIVQIRHIRKIKLIRKKRNILKFSKTMK